MTPIERKARELLAAEYEKEGIAEVDTDTFGADRAALRALITALTPPAGELPDLPELFAVLDKATPGEWSSGIRHDGEFIASATGGALQKGDGSHLAVSATAAGFNYDDAPAIAAAVNWLRANRSALEAIAASRVGWLPIESAPKDGSYILLADANFAHTCLIARWHKPTKAWWGQLTRSGHSIVWNEATHWQPLPAAPQVALNRGG